MSNHSQNLSVNFVVVAAAVSVVVVVFNFTKTVTEGVPLAEFKFLVFTRMPRESYRGRYKCRVIGTEYWCCGHKSVLVLWT